MNGKTTLTQDEPAGKVRNGFTDQERKIDEVIDHDLEAYGLVCTAVDLRAKTRVIKSINDSYLVTLKLRRVNGVAEARHGKRIYLIDFIQSDKNSAIDDLPGADPVGVESPDRALRSSYAFKRDSKVRFAVIKRAHGKCEYCGKSGFLMSSGDRYIEAHHVIALAKQGPDTLRNVIALCPEHHREAHYGAKAVDLEKKFLVKLKAL